MYRGVDVILGLVGIEIFGTEFFQIDEKSGSGYGKLNKQFAKFI